MARQGVGRTLEIATKTEPSDREREMAASKRIENDRADVALDGRTKSRSLTSAIPRRSTRRGSRRIWTTNDIVRTIVTLERQITIAMNSAEGKSAARSVQ